MYIFKNIKPVSGKYNYIYIIIAVKFFIEKIQICSIQEPKIKLLIIKIIFHQKL